MGRKEIERRLKGDRTCSRILRPRRSSAWIWVVPSHSDAMRTSRNTWGHQRSSAVIIGQQRSSAVISGNHLLGLVVLDVAVPTVGLDAKVGGLLARLGEDALKDGRQEREALIDLPNLDRPCMQSEAIGGHQRSSDSTSLAPL